MLLRNPKPLAFKVREIGRYQTREGCAVQIVRLAGGRAYGCFPGTADLTWWYAETGEHGLYTPDDLVQKLES